MRVNTNIITIKNGYAEIQTVKGEIIIIDISDVDKCKEHSWSIDSKGYPSSGGKGLRTTRLHRFLLQPPKGMQVDHINHNKLDNRRCNLRIVTNQQNHFNRPLNSNNSSGVKGVYWNKQCQKWCSQITINGKTISGGLFNNLNDAILKRIELENKYFN